MSWRVSRTICTTFSALLEVVGLHPPQPGKGPEKAGALRVVDPLENHIEDALRQITEGRPEHQIESTHPDI